MEVERGTAVCWCPASAATRARLCPFTLMQAAAAAPAASTGCAYLTRCLRETCMLARTACGVEVGRKNKEVVSVVGGVGFGSFRDALQCAGAPCFCCHVREAVELYCALECGDCLWSYCRCILAVGRLFDLLHKLVPGMTRLARRTQHKAPNGGVTCCS